MSNESQYYAPIIQAYLEATRGMQQGKQEQDRLKLEQQKQDQQKAQQDQLLQQAQERIDEERDYHLKENENSKALRDIAAQNSHMATSKFLTDMIRNQNASPEAAAGAAGIPYNPPQTPTPQQPTNLEDFRQLAMAGQQPQQQNTLPNYQNQPATFTMPGGANVPVSGFQTQDQAQAAALKQKVAETAAVTTAQRGAAEPFEISDEARKAAQKQADEDFLEHMEYIKANAADVNSKLERKTQVQIAQMHESGEFKRAQLQYDISPDDANAMITGAATGQWKPNIANPKERSAVNAVIAQGGRIPDPKEGATLAQMAMLGPILDKMEAFADEYLPDENETGGKVKAYLQGKGLKTDWPSDVKNAANQITSQAMQVARTLDGVTSGRIPVQQMQQVTDALAAGGITRQQAHANIDFIKNNVLNKEQNSILAGMPDWQKDLNMKTYGVKPPAAPASQTPGSSPISGSLPGGQIPTPGGGNFLNVAPPANSAGHKLNRAASLQTGQPVYSPNGNEALPTASAPGPTQ